MVPELVILAACMFWTTFGSFRSLPRYRHWRGPQESTLDDVQREHLQKFHDPSRYADEEFGHE